MKISVISLFRDSEDYIHKAFKNLEALEGNYGMEYFFYENDSKDNTARLLKGWMEKRQGIIVSENLGAPKFAQTTDPVRFFMMAGYRNKILDEAKPLDSQWTLLLDSDVDFPENIIEKYLSLEIPDVVMYTPCIEHNIKCHMCEPRCDKPAYFDHFALRDRNDRLGQLFSCNPFWEKEDREAWAQDKPVEVHCAFGGAVLIKSGILNRCYWNTEGDCEHVLFAEQVREHGKIVAVPFVKTWTEVEEMIPNPDSMVRQRRMLEDSRLLDVATLNYKRQLEGVRRIVRARFRS